MLTAQPERCASRPASIPIRDIDHGVSNASELLALGEADRRTAMTLHELLESFELVGEDVKPGGCSA